MVANDDTQVGGRTQAAVANSQKKTRVWKKFLGPKSVSTLLQWIIVEFSQPALVTVCGHHLGSSQKMILVPFATLASHHDAVPGRNTTTTNDRHYTSTHRR